MKTASQVEKSRKWHLLDLIIDFSETGRDLDKFLKLLDDILSFGSEGLEGDKASTLLMYRSRREAYCKLLGIKDSEAEGYYRKGEKKYGRVLLELIDDIADYDKNKFRPSSFFQRHLEWFINTAKLDQIDILLAILFKHKLFDEIVELRKHNSREQPQQDRIKAFILAHLEHPELLVLCGDLLGYFESNSAHIDTIFGAVQALGDLRKCEEESEKRVRVRQCAEFLQNYAIKQSSLKADTNNQLKPRLLALLMHLKEVNDSTFASTYLAFGFSPFSGTLLPLIDMEDRMALLSDNRFILEQGQVNEALKDEKNPTTEYVVALKQRVEQDKKTGAVNPRLPSAIANHILRERNSERWDASSKELFRAALVHPISQIDRIPQCSNASALVAIFVEPWAFAQNRDRYLLRRPYVVVSEYRKLSNETNGIEYNGNCTVSYNELDKLQNKESVFIQCCPTLAAKMTEKEAETMLRFLIADKTRYPLISNLLDQNNTCAEALKGYLTVYLELMSNPDADTDLIEIIEPYGGLMMPVMSVDQFSAIIDRFIRKGRLPQFVELLFNADPISLPKPMAQRLLTLFTVEASANSDLKKVLYEKGPYGYYVGLLFSEMNTDDQRLALLNDPEVPISTTLVEKLMPENGDILIGSASCVDVLLLRSASENWEMAVAHIVKVLEKREGAIVRLFTETVQDPVRGKMLSDILLIKHFRRFFDFLMSRANAIVPDSQPYKQISAFIDQLILGTQDQDFITCHSSATILRDVLRALIVGCNKEIKANRHNSNYELLAKRVFAKEELHQCLFSAKVRSPEVSLFTSVVDTLVELDTTVILDPLFRYMISTPERMDDVLQFLRAALGSRAVKLKTEEHRSQKFINLNVIRKILNLSRSYEERIENILRVGPKFVLRCAQIPGKAHAEALELFLNFGCRPLAEYMDGERSDKDISDVRKLEAKNPYHLAVAYMERHFSLLIPTFKRIPVQFLRVFLNHSNFDADLFQPLLETALKLDPQFIKDPALQVLMRECVHNLMGGDTKEKLAIFMQFVSLGVEPTVEDFEQCLSQTRRVGLSDADLCHLMQKYAPQVLVRFAQKQLSVVPDETKLEFLGMLVKISSLGPNQVEAYFGLLSQILEYNKLDSVVIRTLYLHLSQKQAMSLVLAVELGGVYPEGKPFCKELRLADQKTPISHLCLNGRIIDSTAQQMQSFLQKLLDCQMYSELLKCLEHINILSHEKNKDMWSETKYQAIIEKRTLCIQFCISHMKGNSRILAMCGLCLPEFSEEQSEQVFEALKEHCGSANGQGKRSLNMPGGPNEVCAEFLSLVAVRKSSLGEPALSQLVQCFRSFSEKIFASDVYLYFGFHAIAELLIPRLKQERLGLLGDARITFTPEQVNAILANEANPSIAYLNALSQRVAYGTGAQRAKAARPESIIRGLVSYYDANHWGEKDEASAAGIPDTDKVLFAQVLTNPVGGIFGLWGFKSVPVLLRLFEQLFLMDQTRQMFFAQKPVEVVRGVYNRLCEDHPGADIFRNSPVSFGNIKQCLFGDALEPVKYELNVKPIPFDSLCDYLAKNMTAAQAGWLLRFLMADKNLHRCLQPLFEASLKHDVALSGYVEPYLKIMGNPKENEDLAVVMTTWGGVLMEQMTSAEFLRLQNILCVGNRRKELSDLLHHCREGGKRLSPDIARTVSRLFVEYVAFGSELKPLLYANLFADLSAVIMPNIKDEAKRVEVLSDKDLVISDKLVQTLIPVGVEPPVALSDECLRVIILRSVSEPTTAETAHVFEHIMRYLEGKKEQAYALLTHCIGDGEHGLKLRELLSKHYFQRYLSLLVEHVDPLNDKAPENQRVMTFIGPILHKDVQSDLFPVMVNTLLEGCGDQVYFTQYIFITRKVMKFASFYRGLLTAHKQLFTDVVDRLALLPLDSLELLIQNLMTNRQFTFMLYTLLCSANGIRAKQLNTYDTHQNSYTSNFRPDIVAAILTEQFRTNIQSSQKMKALGSVGSALIARCCSYATDESAHNLGLILDFGFKPEEKYCKGDAVDNELKDPFQVVARLGSPKFLSLLMPYIKKVPLIVFSQLMKSANFTMVNFQYLLTLAQDKDPDFISHSASKIYDILADSSTGFPNFTRRNKSIVQAIKMLVNKGVEPSAEQLVKLDYRVREVVEEHTPNASILAAILENNTLEQWRLFKTHKESGRLRQETLHECVKWALDNPQSAEFVESVINLMIPNMTTEQWQSVLKTLSRNSRASQSIARANLGCVSQFAVATRRLLENEGVRDKVFRRDGVNDTVFSSCIFDLIDLPLLSLSPLVDDLLQNENQDSLLELLAACLGLKSSHELGQWKFENVRNQVSTHLIRELLTRCEGRRRIDLIVLFVPRFVERCSALSKVITVTAMSALELLWEFASKNRNIRRLDLDALKQIRASVESWPSSGRNLFAPAASGPRDAIIQALDVYCLENTVLENCSKIRDKSTPDQERVRLLKELISLKESVKANKLGPDSIVETLIELINEKFNQKQVDELLEAFELQKLFAAEPAEQPVKKGLFGGLFSASTASHSILAAQAYLCIVRDIEPNNDVLKQAVSKMLNTSGVDSCLPAYLKTEKYASSAAASRASIVEKTDVQQKAFSDLFG